MKKFIVCLLLAFIGLGYLIWQINQRLQIVSTHSTSLTQGVAGICQLPEEEYRDGGTRFSEIRDRMTPHLESALSKKGLALGSPVFLRSFKEEKELELWLLDESSQDYKLAQVYTITGLSGDLGPKLEEGDKQSPEGFYHVALPQFLPSSTNHLAFNVGFPNAFDRAHDRTGSFIMIHGRVGSIGCLAMTDPYIEEIYTICHAALSSGKQKRFQVQMFPFRMTSQNMNRYVAHKDHPFWQDIREGYDYFEAKRVPPKVRVENKKYVFE